MNPLVDSYSAFIENDRYTQTGLAGYDPSSLNDAIDRVVASLDPSVELLSFGEPLHGREEVLIFDKPAKTHLYRDR
ncbi:hypothetical protein [Candidatus Methanocrinis natronophilus]|uniref:Uncharacterized protein n=1 Tax=Candidatus Methanocrinis natronophilus TaxID=3033396 RepID=A0ABT5X8M1_9EURY|nr:hypothetical protein [Candidatus Methanocrinis natronophilus]MDF0591032.1 hypothetical protein [Candidatus Methanocrinis natronophilus]